MPRTFGIEIEMYSPNERVDRDAVANALVDNGIDAFSGSYGRNPAGRWMVKTDGSIRPDGYGVPMELVSPVLQGEDGIEQVRKVGEVLVGLGMRVNTSTGLHVHFGASDLSVEVGKKVVERYAKFQNEVDAIMPASRRASARNGYALPVSDIASRIIGANAVTIADLARVQRSRYYAVNLMAYLEHRTIEIRQHSGTVEPDKMVNWIRFGLAFIERCRVLAANVATAVVSVVSPRRSSRRFRIVQMIREGKTLPEMAAELGKTESWLIWQVRMINRDFNCEYRLVGRRGTVRHYEIVREMGNAEVAPAPEADNSIFDGCPVEVISFYRDRAASLAR